MKPHEIGQNLLGQGIRLTWSGGSRVGVIQGALASVTHEAAFSNVAQSTRISIQVSDGIRVELGMGDLRDAEIESV